MQKADIYVLNNELIQNSEFLQEDVAIVDQIKDNTFFYRKIIQLIRYM